MGGYHILYGCHLFFSPAAYYGHRDIFHGRMGRNQISHQIFSGKLPAHNSHRQNTYPQQPLFGYDGDIHHMPANKMCPVPSRPTPVLIGGHAEPALKRAARVGDGWMCAGADMTQLGAYIKRINQLRDEYGTTDRPFRIFTTGQDAFTREGIAALEELGVTDVIIGFRNVYEMEPDKPLDEKIAMLNWYAGEFIHD